jgi:hypothetical protein
LLLGEIGGYKIAATQLDNDLIFSGVRFTEICGITEAENVSLRREGEGLSKF